jgi:hypothetical protein
VRRATLPATLARLERARRDEARAVLADAQARAEAAAAALMAHRARLPAEQARAGVADPAVLAAWLPVFGRDARALMNATEGHSMAAARATAGVLAAHVEVRRHERLAERCAVAAQAEAARRAARALDDAVAAGRLARLRTRARA